ncbi:MAG: transporter substrate-binding domain-containing protein [Desulfoplanes sp.]|nr:transporter substrate-binding domain-containing protein [Desulfoplanes sp.]MDD4648550.1 transporter substrate-binding domain-containing protein [Desulfoplanes sp.]
MHTTRLHIFWTMLALLLVLPGPAQGRPVYKIGVRAISPPFSFLSIENGNQVIRGYTIDEWLMIGKFIKADIKFIQIPDLNKRKTLLKAGKIHFISHGTRELAKELGYTFIPVDYSLKQHLYVNKSCTSVTCLKDLHRKRISIMQGVDYDPAVHKLRNVIEVPSGLEALNMLNNGVVDVFIAPSEKEADYIIAAQEFKNVLKKGMPLREIPLGIMIPPDKPELTLKLEKAVEHLKSIGALQQLRDKWFGRSITDTSRLGRYAQRLLFALSGLGIFLIVTMGWSFLLRHKVAQITKDLRRTEQRYRVLIESSPDMIFLVNEEGTILHANKQVQTTLSLEPDQNIPIDHIMDKEDVPGMKAFLHKLFNDGYGKHEFTLRGRGGDRIVVEIAGQPIEEEQAEDMACLFARDVSERNKMEEDLIQSERLAIIGKMAASVAHEINNPLSIIQANAEELLYSDHLTTDIKEGLSAILRNAERAGEITRGVLAQSAPKALCLEKINVQDLLEQSVMLVSPKAKKNTITIKVTAGPLFFNGDVRSLQQVFMNLLFNALEHTDSDKQITLTAVKTGTGENSTIQIVVRDQGQGIVRKNLRQIFEPFFTSRKGGFGLGLFISRRIVERNNGLIYAESESGKGTAMILEFPAIKG